MDNRFDTQPFTLQELADLARLAEEKYAPTVANVAEAIVKTHEAFQTWSQEGVLEDVLLQRGEYGADMGTVGHRVMTALDGYPLQMFQMGASDETAIEIMSRLMEAMERERAEVFSGISPDVAKRLEPLDRKKSKELAESIYGVKIEGIDSDTKRYETIGGIFSDKMIGYLNYDIEALGDQVIAVRKERTAAQAFEKILAMGNESVRAKIGRHTLDVLKVAAGVTIGVVAARFFRKK